MARFSPGQPKPVNSGRRAGTPNKKSLDLKEALEAAGVDLPTRIAELIPGLSAREQMDMYIKLLEFIYPKRKAVAFSDSEENGCVGTVRRGQAIFGTKRGRSQLVPGPILLVGYHAATRLSLILNFEY